MAVYVTGGRGSQSKAMRAATLITRLQTMQRDIDASRFAVFRLNGNGLPAARKLTCVLDNWGTEAEMMAHELVRAYGDELKLHLDDSLLPLLWNGSGEGQTADTVDFERFVRRVKGRQLPFAGIAFPCVSARRAMAM